MNRIETEFSNKQQNCVCFECLRVLDLHSTLSTCRGHVLADGRRCFLSVFRGFGVTPEVDNSS